MENEKKNLLKKMVEVLFKTEETATKKEVIKAKFGDIAVSVNGELFPAHIVSSVEGEINIGDEFFLVDESGEKIETPAADYEYSGMVISVDAQGIITDIQLVDPDESEESEEEMEAKKDEENFTTITSIAKWDVEVNEETIQVGTKLKEVGFDGQEWRLNDGEYLLPDGRNIQVDSEGIVVLISDDPAKTNEELESSKEENLEEQLLTKLAEMLSEFTGLKEELVRIKQENKTIKEGFEKFSKEPSTKSTNTSANFSQMNKNKNKIKSGVIHSMI